MRNNNVGFNFITGQYISILITRNLVQNGDFPNSEKYGTSSFSLPLHIGINNRDQDTVISFQKGIKKLKSETKV